MKGLQIPERFTGTVYVCIYGNPTDCLYGHITVSGKKPNGEYGEIIIGQVEIDIPLDHAGSLDKQVEQLRASKRKIIDDASAKAGQIDDAIESLLAIEYKGEQL